MATLFRPGEKAPVAGRYMCSGTPRRRCDHRVDIRDGERLPGCIICRQNTITWQLVQQFRGPAPDPLAAH